MSKQIQSTLKPHTALTWNFWENRLHKNFKYTTTKPFTCIIISYQICSLSHVWEFDSEKTTAQDSQSNCKNYNAIDPVQREKHSFLRKYIKTKQVTHLLQKQPVSSWIFLYSLLWNPIFYFVHFLLIILNNAVPFQPATYSVRDPSAFVYKYCPYINKTYFKCFRIQ